eukprot:maker-scaffold_5-snap-gene-14.0-mRNA-1 protein AED:0.01 eAED:0.01 QI:222/1/1/1/1/1/2/22/209
MNDKTTSEKEVAQVYRVFKTIMKMLSNRKYLVPEHEKDISLQEFKEKFGSPLNRTLLTYEAQKIEDPEDKITVFFPDDEKVGVKPIREYIDYMSSGKLTRGILVCATSITPLAKQALQELKPKYIMEYFLESELLIDITEHELVPKHEVLTKTQKDQLLEGYKIKPEQLPRMKIDDPVARYFGLQYGEVVKIIRPSETAGRYVTYRIVA